MASATVTFDQGQTRLELVDVELVETAGLMGEVLLGTCAATGRAHRVATHLIETIERS